MKHIYMFTVMMLLAGLLVGCADKQQVSIDYGYDRPAGLKSLSKDLDLLIPRVAEKATPESGERRAKRLAEAVGLDISFEKRKIDKHNEVLWLGDDRHRFKVYVPSGMVIYRDRKTHNRSFPEDQDKYLPGREKVLEWAKKTVKSLEGKGLVDARQLLMEAAHISHRMENQAAGATQGQKGQPKIASPRPMDTRIFFARAIDGIGVSGHGLQLTFTHQGVLTGLDLLWRDVTLEEGRYPVKHGMEEARRIFEKSFAEVAPGTLVKVFANELVYFDTSQRDPLSFLEPSYLFVYTVRTPLPGRKDYAVSKKLHFRLAAVDHDLTQPVSPSAKREAELEKQLLQARPKKSEPIIKKDEGET